MNNEVLSAVMATVAALSDGREHTFAIDDRGTTVTVSGPDDSGHCFLHQIETPDRVEIVGDEFLGPMNSSEVIRVLRSA